MVSPINRSKTSSLQALAVVNQIIRCFLIVGFMATLLLRVVAEDRPSLTGINELRKQVARLETELKVIQPAAEKDKAFIERISKISRAEGQGNISNISIELKARMKLAEARGRLAFGRCSVA